METSWHALSYDDVLQMLQSSEAGLSSEEANLGLEKFGPNKFQVLPSESLLKIILRQLHNPLIYILIASTLLALLLGNRIDAFVILSVVLLNTLIGVLQEYHSSKTIHSLMHMVPQKSTVKRNGKIVSLLSSELVPGDVVLLESGNLIPADLRLLSVKNLQCDESALTGESLPVFKSTKPVSVDVPLSCRTSMMYNGTLVTTGAGIGVVVATGIKTEFGKISQLLTQVSPVQTPLAHALGQIATWITLCVLLASAGLFGVGYYRGYSMLDAVFASIALAVAAIPEGLPAAITIAAAVGVQRMARKKAVIRHLLAVETLGSTTVICTDKTGTLTQNEMTVQTIWTPQGAFFVTGIGYSPEGQIFSQNSSHSLSNNDYLDELLTGAMLCNDAYLENKENRWTASGDPTEIALLAVGHKRGLAEERIRSLRTRLDVIPFDSEMRIMTTLNSSTSSKNTIFVKGAPEVVSQLCEGDVSQMVRLQVEEMASQGMRVIGVAKKEVQVTKASLEPSDIQGDFVFLGLLGMIDPPRPEVLEAIKKCQLAGIQIKMITGDHPLTATIIAQELGLNVTGTVLGQELDNLNGSELTRLVCQNTIFARALPEHKLKIVEALQASHQVVAMTGDGVNDAPALKRANIGVAMGISGTAVAKEAADMILADDNFASIAGAVEEGRRVYDNLIKSIAFMFPTNLAQALVILIAVLFFPIQNKILLMPMLPVQILWVNLIVAVALALPLAFETQEPDIMQRPPRNPHTPILSAFIWLRTLLVTALMTAGTIWLFFLVYSKAVAMGTLETKAASEAQTMAVTTLVLFQLFYLINCRSLRFSVFRIGFFSNPYVLMGGGFVLLTQLAFVYHPVMNKLFGSSPMDGVSWLIAIGVSFCIVPIIAFEKWLSKKMKRKDSKREL